MKNFDHPEVKEYILHNKNKIRYGNTKNLS